MLPLIKKYEPQTKSEIIAQDEAIIQIDSFIENYKKQKKKSILVYGPTGIGKTAAAYALAADHQLEIFELNSSDFRNKDQINQKLGSALKQQSLFSQGKLILIDDVDALSGTKDRGAIAEIIKLMQKSVYPIILTATDPYSKKISSLRSKAVLVEFSSINNKEICAHLTKIAKKENLNIPQDTIKSISRRAAGDLRAAINDLQILSSLKNIDINVLEELGMREKQENIIEALVKILKTTDPNIAITAFDYVNETVDEQLLWLDENIPKEYTKPADLARAYDKLSKADLFQRRIRRWQHWRFLVYINALITAGVAVSKDKKYDTFTQYKPTGRILKMWWAKQKSLKKKAIAEKIAQNTHTSTRQTIQSMPYFQYMFKNNKQVAQSLTEELDLDKDQVDWLKK